MHSYDLTSTVHVVTAVPVISDQPELITKTFIDTLWNAFANLLFFAVTSSLCASM